MADQDYYDLLGVERGADDAALKSAFRKKAMQFHPDRNPGDAQAEARFKQINEAYDVLKDPQKRSAYDRFGKAAFQNGAGQGFEGFTSSFSDIFEDLFGDFMGNGGRGRGGGRSAGRGADLRANVEVTLEEAYKGKTAQITLPTAMTCEPCGGTGAEPGTRPEPCRTCGGQGKVRTTQGFFMVERACPACHGAGAVIANPCKNCGGQGRVTREKTLKVKIPAGISDGTRIRLSGEGEGGLRGGPPGDLYLFISVSPHRVFQRDQTHLFCNIPLPMTTAALGGEIEVPSLDGARTTVKIPSGTQSGRQFSLRGKGMPSLNGSGFGDLIIQVGIETPVNLTKRQRELLEEFASLTTNETSPESDGFFGRLKDMWNELRD